MLDNQETMRKTGSKSIISNMFWRFAERMGAQLVTFVVSLILARMLEPEAYGLISILLVFITLADTLVTSGFGNALIQKKNADQLDFSSVFYFNIVFSLAIYALVFCAAPIVEKFYGTDYSQLCVALRIMALQIPITAINNVQQAYVSRNMAFKKFFFATLWGTIGSAIIGIALAWMGAGIWALVAQYLTNSIIGTLVLWFSVRWRPLRSFSFSRLKSLLQYGWKLLVAGLLDALYNDLRTLLIGKLYSSEDLAYYNRGKQFPGLVVDNVNTTIISVMFPAIATIQNQKQEIKALCRKSVQISSYVIVPLLIGLAAVAEPVICLLLTDKWLSAVPYMQIFCLVYMLQPISKPNQQIIKGLGRSDLHLALEIAKKVIGIALLLASLNHGVLYIAYAFAIASIINCLMDMIVGGKLVGYRFTEQLCDIAFPIAVSAVMFIVLHLVSNCFSNMYITLLVQIVIAVILYVGASIITRNKSFAYLLRMLGTFLHRKKKTY